jgi:hypothetical protein
LYGFWNGVFLQDERYKLSAKQQVEAHRRSRHVSLAGEKVEGLEKYSLKRLEKIKDSYDGHIWKWEILKDNGVKGLEKEYYLGG